MEIKNLNNPLEVVKQVIVTVANFIEGSDKHTWQTARGKMLDFVKRGVGAREQVSESQMVILRAFAATSITEEQVKAKSSAAANFASYLIAMHKLQEHLFHEGMGMPITQTVEELAMMRTEANEGMYATIQGSNPRGKGTNDLNELYYGQRPTTAGAKNGSHKRKRSAGYLGATQSSNKKTTTALAQEEMERKAAKDAKQPLDDSDIEELGIDGKPKHRFYNEELEIKTKAIQD